MAQLADEIIATLQEYEAYWQQHDIEALQGMWDGDEPEPIFVAEEEAEPIIGWEALERYRKALKELTKRSKFRTFDHRIKAVAPDVALAFFKMQWNDELREGGLFGGEMFGGVLRASVLLRKKPEGWRIFHWVEAPIIALTQLQIYYRQNVDPDFAKGA